MGNHIAGRRGPVCLLIVVARNPFATDIGVDLHAVRVAVGGRSRDGNVGEW